MVQPAANNVNSSERYNPKTNKGIHANTSQTDGWRKYDRGEITPHAIMDRGMSASWRMTASSKQSFHGLPNFENQIASNNPTVPVKRSPRDNLFITLYARER